jgi:RNA polymerase sigma-70 factor (ECF subfamily)
MQKLTDSLDILSDNSLMLKVREGDLDKMGLLFGRYHRPLYGFLFHMTKQKEASEDMVQNVFFRMLKYRHSFTGGEFKTWMYHLARNVLSDHFKKDKKMSVQHTVTAAEEKIPGGPLPDEPIKKKQELKALEDAMAGLSVENRELLILSRYQELRYSEIARILEVSEGAVKVRMHRALQQLKMNFLKTSE